MEDCIIGGKSWQHLRPLCCRSKHQLFKNNKTKKRNLCSGHCSLASKCQGIPDQGLIVKHNPTTGFAGCKNATAQLLNRHTATFSDIRPCRISMYLFSKWIKNRQNDGARKKFATIATFYSAAGEFNHLAVCLRKMGRWQKKLPS